MSNFLKASVVAFVERCTLGMDLRLRGLIASQDRSRSQLPAKTGWNDPSVLDFSSVRNMLKEQAVMFRGLRGPFD
jgi:hypothetical protein